MSRRSSMRSMTDLLSRYLDRASSRTIGAVIRALSACYSPAVASEQAMARLNLVLFGGFRATIGARRVALPLKKAQALLAFLALSPSQRQTRERLAALFWGDTPDEHARNSLRQTLFAIRGALGRSSAQFLGGDAAAVWLEPGAVEVDVLAFERFAAQETDDALARATTLYQGDLLDGGAVEAGAFDEWLAPTRERLRAAAATAMAKLLDRQSRA